VEAKDSVMLTVTGVAAQKKLSEGQLVQDADAGTEKEPASQALQEAEPAVEKVPASQAVHVNDSSVDENMPATQGRQLEPFTELRYEPAGQLMGAEVGS